MSELLLVSIINVLIQLADHLHEVVTTPKQLQEPVVTWNLFLTAILVPTCTAISSGIIVAYINHRMKRKELNDNLYRQEREKKEAEIVKLYSDLDKEKMKATIQWRENHSAILCRVKENVDNIYSYLDKKVDKEDCDRLMKNV